MTWLVAETPGLPLAAPPSAASSATLAAACRRGRLPAGSSSWSGRLWVISSEPAGLTKGTPVALPKDGPYAGRGVTEQLRSIGIEVDQVLEEVSVRTCLLAEAAALGRPAGSA